MPNVGPFRVRFGRGERPDSPSTSSTFSGSPILALRRRAQRRIEAEPSASVHAACGALGESTAESRSVVPSPPTEPRSESGPSGTLAQRRALLPAEPPGLLAMPTPIHSAEFGDGDTRVIFFVPRRMVSDVASDYDSYLHTHYDAGGSVSSSDDSFRRPPRSQAGSQHDELDALTARLHGLRLLLTLSQAASPNEQPGGSALLASPFEALLSALAEPLAPPPPPGVPSERLEELMPRMPFFVARRRGNDPLRRLPTECNICLECLESEQMCRVLPCRHVFHQCCARRPSREAAAERGREGWREEEGSARLPRDAGPRCMHAFPSRTGPSSLVARRH